MGGAAGALIDRFFKGDAERMRSFVEGQVKETAVDYLMTEAEVAKLAGSINKRLDGGMLKDMFASDDRAAFVAALMKCDIEKIISERSPIAGDIDGRIADGFVKVLEESAREVEGGGREDSAQKGC